MNENDPRADAAVPTPDRPAAHGGPDALAPTGADAVARPAEAAQEAVDPALAPVSPSPLETVHASVAVAGGAATDPDAGAVDGASDEAAEAATDPGSGAGVRRALGYVAAAVAGGALVLAVLAAGGRIGGVGSASASPSPSPAAAASPAASAAITGAAPVLGDPAAPVLVEIWADYQCPYCGALSHVIEPALERDYVESGKIRLVYRDFSFLGTESTEAAAAAVCAGRQDAYWRYHDLLFASQQGENQGAFAAANLVSLAKYAGLDTQAFVTCMSDPAIRTAIDAETAQGRALGVASTPTLRLVGPMGTKIVKGLTTLAVIDAAIAEVTTGVVPSPSPGASGSAAAPSDAPASTQSAATPAPSAPPSVTSPAP